MKTTIDNEWQKIMNGATNVNFNFYDELKNMVSTVKTDFIYPPGRLSAPNTWTCAVKLMAQKLQAYWNPVNECYVSISLCFCMVQNTLLPLWVFYS